MLVEKAKLTSKRLREQYGNPLYLLVRDKHRDMTNSFRVIHLKMRLTWGFTANMNTQFSSWRDQATQAQAKAKRDQAKAKREQAKAERDQAKAEWDQAKEKAMDATEATME